MGHTLLPLGHCSRDILARFRQPNMQLLAVLVVWHMLWLGHLLILHNGKM